jgi:hypothetical protein
MDEEYVAVWSLSSVPAMLDEADALLALAASNPIRQQTIASCSTVLLAAALDQGTLTVLARLAVIEAHQKRAGPGAAPCTVLYQESLRRRITRLPEVLTDSRLCLDARSVHVQKLHDMVSKRNELMHVIEEPEVERSQLPEEPTEEWMVNLGTPAITNPWLLLRMEDAKAFRTAVQHYVDEVLFPPKGEIKLGGIVRARARSNN